MEKIFLYDLETTGVKFWKNGVHQISGMIIENGLIMEKFDYKVKPYKDALIEEEALKVGNVTKEQILAYPEMSEVFYKLERMLGKYVDKFDKFDKFHLMGYNNASFDNQFFRAFFTQNATTPKEAEYGNFFGSWFWSDSIDVMVLASWYLMSSRSNLANFQQRTVARYLGIEVDETKLHDAQYDIELCYAIYKHIIERS